MNRIIGMKSEEIFPAISSPAVTPRLAVSDAPFWSLAKTLVEGAVAFLGGGGRVEVLHHGRI